MSLDKVTIYDPNLALEIPAWVIDNIQQVSAWMKAQGHESWRIAGIGPITPNVSDLVDAIDAYLDGRKWYNPLYANARQFNEFKAIEQRLDAALARARSS